MHCPIETRNQVLRFLHHVTGPAIGLPALRALFPHVPRCVLENLLRRYRRVWRQRYCPFGLRLIWHRAGSVWAIDFSKAPYPIDGIYTHIFAVRDLASHFQIAWLPVCGEQAEQVLRILRQLFDQHGPPLVLKSDNGSAFLAELLRAAMGERQVVQLFSPAGRPAYNGALERSNRTNKIYTGQHALSAGHPFQWLSPDLEAARNLANDISRPWGAKGPTPREVWEVRSPLADEERALLLQQLGVQRETAAAELGIDLSQPLDHDDRSRLDRHALPTVLQQLDYLTYRRGARFTRQPPRPSDRAIAKRARQFAADAPKQPAAVAAALPPLLGARPCIDHARNRGAIDSRLGAEHQQPPPCAEPNARVSPSPVVPRARPPDNSAVAPITQPDIAVMGFAAICRDSRDATARPRGAGVQETLAQPARAGTMQAAAGSADAVPDEQRQTEYVHRERTHTSWLRSPITPLISFLKAAKIMR